MYVIYKHTNRISGKCYIGKSKWGVEQRWIGHVTAAVKGHSSHFCNAIRHHPLDSWDHEILETVTTNEEANLSEIKWIEAHKSNDPCHGYNMTRGGDGGMTISSEAMSEKMKDVPKSPEHKQHMREAQERYWSENPDDPRKKQLAERNSSPEGKEASRLAQQRRWSKPGAREAMRAKWADPEWRAKTLEARRLARERSA